MGICSIISEWRKYLEGDMAARGDAEAKGLPAAAGDGTDRGLPPAAGDICGRTFAGGDWSPNWLEEPGFAAPEAGLEGVRGLPGVLGPVPGLAGAWKPLLLFGVAHGGHF